MYNSRSFPRMAGLLFAILVLTAKSATLFAQDASQPAAAATATAQATTTEPVIAPYVAAPLTTDTPEAAGAVVVTTKPVQFIPNQLIVKLAAPTAGQAKASAAQATTLLQSFAQAAPAVAILKVEPLFSQSAAKPLLAAQADTALTAEARQQINASGLDRIYAVTLQGDPTQLVAALQANPAVQYAQLNYLRQTVALPNDTLYPHLWALTNVQAANAWTVATGSGVIVAVIDTGVALTHPDLQGNLYTKPGEIAGNGLDDDGNGFVDDSNGWDFVNNDNNPNDGHGHGSHVAGTIAAVGNNNRGVIGLAYQSRILPIKGLSDNGSGTDTQLANAILYAVNNGAQVINNSWGGPGESPLFEDVINYTHAHGVVVVSAAGNDNQNACHFTPANVENSLTVAAVGPTDAKAGYSNFGGKVDVAAPGGSNINAVSENILSTVPNGAFASAAGFTGPSGEEYRAIAGTSMASPHVAALAALILQLHPTWTPEQVRQVIRQSSNDIGAAGFDPQSGYGRINAQQAVNFGNNPPPTAAIRHPRNCAIVRGVVPVNGIASTTALVTYTVEIGAGEAPATFIPVHTGNSAVVSGTLTTVDTTLLPDGPATIRLRVRDANGLISEERNVITVDNTQITAPTHQQLLATSSTPSVAVYGRFATTVAGTPFSQYTLEYAHSATPASYVTILTANTLPPASGLLGTWSLSGVPDGAVNLRLTVQHGTFTSRDEVPIIVDQLLKPGWPATVGHNGLFVGADGTTVAYALKSPMVADLDRDGSNEIVYGATVLQPNGTVRPGWSAQPGLGRTNPVILDIDQNGSLEVVAAVFTQWWSHPSYTSEPNYGAPVIYAYRHDKSVLWSHPVDNPASRPGYDSGLPSSLSAGDVDGDGEMEIVFSLWFNYENSARQTTLWILNAATGAVEQNFTVDGSAISSVALGNLDSDPALEMVINSYHQSSNSGIVYALNSDGSAVAGWPQTMASVAGAGEIDPVLGDVDQDGQLEVLVGKNLWRNNGVAYPGWPVANLARSTNGFAQLDSDPALELILGGGNSVLYWGMDDNGAILSLNWKSDENLYELFSGENGTQGVPILADVNGDGNADILRPSELGYPDRRPSKLYGAEPAVAGSSLPGFPRYLASPGWGIIRSSALVDDIDCDGKTDLLVAGGDQLYGWNLNTTFNRANNPWPTFQHDRLHTGNYQAVVDSMSACDLPRTPPIAVVDVWTEKAASQTPDTTFEQGELIKSNTLISNTTGSTQVVSGLWRAIGPCGSIFATDDPTWSVSAGTEQASRTWNVPLTACPGVYTFTVALHYQGLTSSKSSSFTVIAVTGPLLAPNRVVASTLAESQLLLTWADRSANEQGFYLERCQVTSGTSCTGFSRVGTVGMNVTTFTSTGLTANTRYCHRLQGYNRSGVSGYSNVACRTTAPPPPSNLSGQTLSRTRIKLTWVDSATNETGFKIERCQGVGCTNFSQIATRAANITTFTNGALTANTTYCYRVRAYNANGNSRYSNAVCPTTMALTVNSAVDAVAETTFDPEGAIIAIAERPRQWQLAPQQQYTIDHRLGCVDEAPAHDVTLWIDDVSVAMQPDTAQPGRYQAIIAVQEPFTTDATYPLVVRWRCANDVEPLEEFIGTMELLAATASPGPNRFFLPVTVR